MPVQFLPPHSNSYEAAVDEAIASCDGNLRGALKALIIANEFLERDLEKALASHHAPSIAHDGNKQSLLAKVEDQEVELEPKKDDVPLNLPACAMLPIAEKKSRWMPSERL